MAENKEMSVINSIKTSQHIRLDERFPKLQNIKGLNINLYPHQATIVHAMRVLETKRNISINKNIKQVHDGAILREPVGSGKTFEILGVILAGDPKPKKEISICVTDQNMMYPVRIRKPNYIDATLIYVGRAVFNQWLLAITKFTNLKVFPVMNVFDFKKFLIELADNNINQYDIVLVKNGNLTTNFKYPNSLNILKSDEYEHQKSISLIQVFSNIVDHTWKRVVYDDYDTIKFPMHAFPTTGLFSWIVSSTKGLCKNVRNFINFNEYSNKSLIYLPLAKFVSIPFSEKNSKKIIKAGVDNKYITYDISCTKNYIKNVCKIPFMKIHIVNIKNSNNIFINALGAINNEKMARFSEMLNGDAIETAAKELGIMADSVGDIFNKILGDKYKKYKHSCDLLEFIEFNKEDDIVEQRKPMSEMPPIKYEIIDDEEVEIEDDVHRTYTKRKLINFIPIDYQYPRIDILLDTTEDEYKEINAQLSNEIDRVKERIAEGECPICCKNLSEGGITINNCCKYILCYSCSTKMQKFKKRVIKNKTILHGICPNCRRNVNYNNMIIINKNISIDDIKDGYIDDDDEEEDKNYDIYEENKLKTPIKRTKITTIFDILNQNEIKEDVRVDMKFGNMMRGMIHMPEVKTRKLLVFANYDETLKKVMKESKNRDIMHWKLEGTINQINKTINLFNESKESCILFINSINHCSGLNLQKATDLVYIHHIINKAIETQVIGRGQRINRNSPLNVWYILYESEYKTMKKSHNIKILTEDDLKNEHEMIGVKSSLEKIVNKYK